MPTVETVDPPVPSVWPSKGPDPSEYLPHLDWYLIFKNSHVIEVDGFSLNSYSFTELGIRIHR
jgi:hypothetical protein